MDTSFLREHSVAIIVIISMIIGIFSYAPMAFVPAAWIWPALLIYGLRRLPLKQAIPITLIAVTVPMLLGHIPALNGSRGGSFPLGDFIICALEVLLVCLMCCLPFILDRLTYQRIGRTEQMFVLPLTWAVMTFAMNLLPWGNALSFAYSQYNFLWFTQGLSIYGLFGIVFILGWFATSVNLFIESYSKEERVDWRSTVCAIVVVAIVVFGGVRVATTNSGNTMDVLCVNGPNHTDGMSSDLTTNIDTLEYFYDEAVKRNADMICTCETAFRIEDKDMDAVCSRASELSMSTGIDLNLGVYYLCDGKIYNLSIFVTHEKGVEWKYYKTHLVPLGELEITPGNGTIYYSDTSHGRITSVICMELDFPIYVNRIDPNADILIAPSRDWVGLDDWHTRNTSFRSIENGVSMVKCTSDGTTATYDAYGRELTHINYHPTSISDMMIIKASTNGTVTFYGQYGMWVDWAFVVAAILLALWCAYPYVRDRMQRYDR